MTGEIRGFVPGSLPPGWLVCDGRTLPVAPYRALHAVIGARFGGDGVATFALPDLVRRLPVHPGGPAPTGVPAPKVRVVYAIAAGATARRRAAANAGEAITLGEVRLFAGDAPPRGWVPCDGQVLRHDNRPKLAALLDDAYGGDGRTTFHLPDLRGRGLARQGAPGPLGDRWDRHPLAAATPHAETPTLAILHMIALDGALPGPLTRSG